MPLEPEELELPEDLDLELLPLDFLLELEELAVITALAMKSNKRVLANLRLGICKEK